MSEDLVLIHAFADPAEAGAAQGELLAAGIHSILVSEMPLGALEAPAGVALAVHRRDVELAATVLALASPQDTGETGAAGDAGRT